MVFLNLLALIHKTTFEVRVYTEGAFDPDSEWSVTHHTFDFLGGEVHVHWTCEGDVVISHDYPSDPERCVCTVQINQHWNHYQSWMLGVLNLERQRLIGLAREIDVRISVLKSGINYGMDSLVADLVRM